MEIYEDSYHVMDINFDGYKDILLLVNSEGNRANHDYVGFVLEC